MSVVKINAIEVPKAWATSSRSASPPAPARSRTWRASRASSCCARRAKEKRYFVYTRWDSEESFQAWVQSSAFTRGHAQAAADRGEKPVAHGSALLEFEVVQKVEPSVARPVHGELPGDRGSPLGLVRLDETSPPRR